MGIAPDGAEIWVPALLILVGIAGIVVPILPGLILTVAGVVLWAIGDGSTTAWACVAVAVALYAAGLTLQYLLPGRRMKAQGVATSTLLLALALAVVGFFVVPVVGAVIGFVLGILLVEQGRSRDWRQAWSRTRHAVVAVLMSMGIELAAGLLIAATFVAGVVATRA
ncbi:MAG TPA: DUF456 domain-containing protein [Dermatophilaceae bacterium]|nr:DUF456 domain-containing protein [Dermatophilaceae bacterium]